MLGEILLGVRPVLARMPEIPSVFWGHVLKFQARISTRPDHKPTPPVRDPNYIQNFLAYEK